MSYVPVKAAEKPAKKKIPEIRRTSLIADKLVKEHKANPSFEWMLSAKPYQWVPGYNSQNPSGGAYKSEYEAKNYIELSHNMEVQYHLLAREDYLINGSPDRVRAFWYMSALTTIYAYKLNVIGYDVIAAILRGNATEARKGILKGIRHIRNSYDMLGEILDIHGCAHLRLAKEYNLAIPAIDAYEVFYNDLNFKKIDKNKWKLPYQDEMDQWLREH